MSEEQIMRDIIGYAKDKMLKTYGTCAVAVMPDRFAEATSTTDDGKTLKVQVTLTGN